jgi:hypothetical protein
MKRNKLLNERNKNLEQIYPVALAILLGILVLDKVLLVFLCLLPVGNIVKLRNRTNKSIKRKKENV